MWHEYFFQKKKEALQLQLRDNFHLRSECVNNYYYGERNERW